MTVGYRNCTRHASYRLARLCAKCGPEIALDDLLRQLTVIAHTGVGRQDGRKSGAFFPDLEPPMRPTDMPRTPLRVVKGGKSK